MNKEIIDRYMKNGRLTTLPKKESVKLIIFEYLANELYNESETFMEQELNHFLKKYYDDYAILRRYMVDYGFLNRDNYGKKYIVIKGNVNDE